MDIKIILLLAVYYVSLAVARQKSIAEVLLPIFRTVGLDFLKRQEMINGLKTSNTFHPYMVSFFNNTDGRHIGGGTLINENWVLSTADFTAWLKAENLFVKVGSNQMEYFIEKYVVHPQYKTLTFEGNLALYKVSEPVRFTGDVQPATVVSRGKVSNKDEATVIGWSATSNSLKELDVKVFKNAYCSTCYGHMFTPKNVICAYKSGAGPCFADWGDPLVQEGKVIGVYIGSYRCANSNFPGMYTQVAPYHDWIQSVTQQGNEGVPTVMRTMRKIVVDTWDYLK